MPPHLQQHDRRIGVVAILIDDENLTRLVTQLRVPPWPQLCVEWDSGAAGSTPTTGRLGGHAGRLRLRGPAWQRARSGERCREAALRVRRLYSATSAEYEAHDCENQTDDEQDPR